MGNAKGFGGIRSGYKRADEEGVGITPGTRRDANGNLIDVGTVGKRPLTDSRNQAAVEDEIKRLNPRAQTGSDMASRRREGALRWPGK